jgi:putative serine/threonine protein kinase
MEIEAPSQEYLKAVLCYPAYDKNVFAERLRNLRDLGVSEVLSKGPSSISRWRILGKGHVGIVVAAKHDGAEVALKILRTDADRRSLEQEGRMLSYANMAEVGPKMFSCTRDFLISELIEGMSMMSWASTGIELLKPDRCARALIFQGFRLDLAGIDHGELSKPDKHVILLADRTPVIIDFESASVDRRCNNLLSLVQFMFIRRTSLRNTFRSFDSFTKSDELLSALRAYKACQSLKNYQRILQVLGLR